MEVEPEVEVEPEAEEEPEVDEEGMSEELDDFTDIFIRKLKVSHSADEEDIIGIVGKMFDAFRYGNSTKLEILKRIKEETIR